MIILKSLLITSIISALFGFSLHKFIGFWEGFCLAWAVQIVASFIYSSFKISREQELIDNFEVELENLLEMSRVTIECPCGKSRFEDLVFVGVDNTFECDTCGNTFKADVSITPTLLTEPISVNKTFDELVKEKEQ